MWMPVNGRTPRATNASPSVGKPAQATNAVPSSTATSELLMHVDGAPAARAHERPPSALNARLRREPPRYPHVTNNRPRPATSRGYIPSPAASRLIGVLQVAPRSDGAAE